MVTEDAETGGVAYRPRRRTNFKLRHYRNSDSIRGSDQESHLPTKGGSRTFRIVVSKSAFTEVEAESPDRGLRKLRHNPCRRPPCSRPTILTDRPSAPFLVFAYSPFLICIPVSVFTRSPFLSLHSHHSPPPHELRSTRVPSAGLRRSGPGSFVLQRYRAVHARLQNPSRRD